MTVRCGKMTFSDWIALPYKGLYTDTFVFHINALNGLPPFEYRNLLQRLAARLNTRRRGASLWIQVDAPGEWYVMEVKRSFALELGLSVPYVVTPVGRIPEWTEFSHPPTLWYSANQTPPTVVQEPSPVSQEELKCLQVLARINEGLDSEIASLAGLDMEDTILALTSLKKKDYACHVSTTEVSDEGESVPIPRITPYLQLTRKGLSLALRSWGVPAGVQFTDRKEPGSKQVRTTHRHISRMWTAWLRSAYPHAEIWTGWSEVLLPEISVRPDALAWGRIQGYETIFWLEVGDEHKKRMDIKEITRKRWMDALTFCRETGVRLVYAQLSPDWVKEAASWGIEHLPPDAAVIMSNRDGYEGLPAVEWGVLTVRT